MSLRDKEWKLIVEKMKNKDPSYELFNIKNDPDELTNLYDPEKLLHLNNTLNLLLKSEFNATLSELFPK